MQNLAALTRVPHLTHRGSVLASGFLLDTELVGVGEARRRVSELRGVDRLLGLGNHLLVTLKVPVRVQTLSSPGLVLVEYQGWLSGLPLGGSALERLGPPPTGGGLVLVRSGTPEVHALNDLSELDPSTWVDLDAFEWLDAKPLRDAPLGAAPNAALAPVEQPDLLSKAGLAISAGQRAKLQAERQAALGEARTLREVLDADGAARGREIEVRSRDGTRRLGNAAGGGALDQSGGFQHGGSRHGGLRQHSVRLLARLLTFVAYFIQRGRPAGLPDPDNASADASWLQRLSERLQSWASSLVLRSQLGSRLMRRQAEFLEETMRLLDRGQWDEALRRAIPLGGDGSEEPKPAALALPSTRRDLSIQPWRGGASSSLNLDTDLYADIRQRYRRAFEALVARGEIEKAAFVLAELLMANEEAVSFLERHGRFGLAAELAEARKLAPGLVVRQWLLAGDRERAVRLAIRHGAFADAIARLERDHRALALQLRALWADRLATAGDFVGAVDAAWGVDELRALVARWIELASRVAGIVAARMLVRRARVSPTEAPAVFERLDRLSAELAPRAEDDDAWRQLRTLSEELQAGADRQATWRLTPEEARGFARLLAPRLLSALGRRGEGVPGRGTPLREVFELCEDPVLEFSLSHAKGQGERPLPPRSLSLERGASDAGSLPIHDAVILPGGKYLIALGELGLWLINGNGTAELRFAEPTERIVFSTHGDRAILLARRGEVWRLSRLDLVARRIQPWRDARFDVFATEFDGQQWFVARGGELMAIDATREWEAERLLDSEAKVLSIAVGGGLVRAWVGGAEAQIWEYSLPELALRRRHELPDLGPPIGTTVNIDSELCVATQSLATEFKGFALSVFTPRAGVRRIFHEEPRVGAPVLSRRLGVTVCRDNVLHCYVYDVEALTADSHLVHLGLEGRSSAPRGSLRLFGEQLLAFDSLGRLLHCDIAGRALVRELRLRPGR